MRLRVRDIMLPKLGDLADRTELARLAAIGSCASEKTAAEGPAGKKTPRTAAQ
jgi:hypothetical protein